MWYEVKIVIGGIGIILVTIVMAAILFQNILLGALLFFALGLWIFADIVFGYVYHVGKGKYLVDRPPGNKTLNVTLTLTNMIDFYWVEKGPYGVRRWVQNKKEASCIDMGNYPIHTPHGVLGFISHEKSEKNINPYDVEMAEECYKEFNTDDINEMYIKAKAQEIEKNGNGPA